MLSNIEKNISGLDSWPWYLSQI